MFRVTSVGFILLVIVLLNLVVLTDAYYHQCTLTEEGNPCTYDWQCCHMICCYNSCTFGCKRRRRFRLLDKR
uniref:Conotoxin Im11.7 n=1 Tax=Conus imperialis TaxID=35631 RepID=F6LPM4_CONIM|nr:conotoxin Im11.7 [Conus imperialis]